MTLVHTYYTPFLLYIYDTLLCVLYGRQYTLLVSVCVFVCVCGEIRENKK